uniref:Uncharacterized protein n=1 Tax=Arundo donax TaxID=35708 RepID=A0A0A9C7H2_ARUDO
MGWIWKSRVISVEEVMGEQCPHDYRSVSTVVSGAEGSDLLLQYQNEQCFLNGDWIAV